METQTGEAGKNKMVVLVAVSHFLFWYLVRPPKHPSNALVGLSAQLLIGIALQMQFGILI
ncbi:MAG: hypothetical protein F3742_11810 [Nitrospinae bacterium]|nr:hypothetical protein [Nitrospinota bacterium]